MKFANLNMTVFAVLLYSLACAVLFGTWTGLVYWGDKLSGAPALISHIQSMLLLLAGHVITILSQGGKQDDLPDAAASPQAGFANPFLLGLMAVCMSLALVACSTESAHWDAKPIGDVIVDMAVIGAVILSDPTPTTTTTEKVCKTQFGGSVVCTETTTKGN